MKSSRILIAVVIVIIIAIIVLLRGPVEKVFTNSDEREAKLDAKAEYSQAQGQFDKAEKSLQLAEVELQTRQDALKKAEEELASAEQKLQTAGVSEEEIKELNDKVEKLRVEVVTLKSEPIASGIVLSGKAEAERKLDVRAETSGQIISEPISSGSQVKKGDVLCELDPGTRQANLSQAQAGLETARTQYNSTRSLQKRNLASTAALQNANAQLEQAQSAVENAQREIERLKITAPFDGVLEQQTAELGSLMQIGSVCASIIALDQLLLVGYAAETQVDKVALGADAIGTFRDGNELKGFVSFVAATADPITRTFRVEVSTENTGQVRDGSSARIAIALAGEKGHLIPQNALTLDDDGRLGVKIVQDNIAIFNEVEMVRDTKEGMWVTGLPDEVDLIISGQEYANDGQEVTAVKNEVTK